MFFSVKLIYLSKIHQTIVIVFLACLELCGGTNEGAYGSDFLQGTSGSGSVDCMCLFALLAVQYPGKGIAFKYE